MWNVDGTYISQVTVKRHFKFNPLIPKSDEVRANFSSHYHPWIKGLSHENTGNDQQLIKLFDGFTNSPC